MNCKYPILLAACLLLTPLVPDASPLWGETLDVNQFDKGAIIRKKLANAERLMREQHDFKNARQLIDEVLKIDPENTNALSLLKELNELVVQAEQTEQKSYEEAVAANTLAALQQFLADYPASKYTEDVNRRIADFELWSKAVQTGSIIGYQNYLSESKSLAYQAEARAAISMLKEQADWEKIQDSDDPDKFAEFLSRYPHSTLQKTATYRLYMLRGNYFYETQQTEKALEYYKQATEIAPLTGKAFTHYKELQDKKEYEDVVNSGDVFIMRTYLENTLQTSPYYPKVSNLLARTLASKFDCNSTEEDFNEALSYVCDEQTRSTVNNLISMTRQAKETYERERRQEKEAYDRERRQEKEAYERERRQAAHREWWKKHLRMGWNIAHFDCYKDYFSLGTGFRVRLGIPKDFLNLIAGVEYSWQGYAYSLEPDNSYEEEEVKFSTITNQIEIPVGLRLNIGRGEGIRFFMGCNADFGFSFGKKDDELRKQTIAFEPQIGLCSRPKGEYVGFELGVLYKQYFKKHGIFSYTNDENKMRFGLFMAFYF